MTDRLRNSVNPPVNEHGRRPLDLAKLARMAPFPGEFDRVKLCGALYPGGHGETRTCDLRAGHSGKHRYDRG